MELVQKLVLVHDHLCVAWSGQEIYARRLVKSLRAFAQDKAAIAHDDLRQFINTYPREDWDGHLDATIYCWHGDGWGVSSNIRPPFDLGAFTNIRVAGSGTPHFIKYVEHLSEIKFAGEIQDYQAAALRGLAYVGLASVEQIFGGTGIEDGWGGGFELVTFDGTRLSKQDRVLWLLCRFEPVEHGLVARLSPTVMFQYYIGSNVYFWIDEGVPDRAARLYEAPPLRGEGEVTIEIPEHFNPEAVICLLRKSSGDQVVNGVFCDFVKPGTEPNVWVDRKDGRIQLAIRDRFLENLFATLPPTDRVSAVETWGSVSPWPRVGAAQQ